ncbi:hypothetical protein ACFRCG_33455 [Embleya sp. NPDC056575]|uniref:hypothetical protein n=1 Tax=unclassified Embleya TaxID=2699296 RepID=UPI00369CAE39
MREIGENPTPDRPRRRPGVAPPGWPRGVRPPGEAGWEDTAVAWLFDQCPPDYRDHAVLRAFPLVLARMARQHVAAALAAARDGYAGARVELRGAVPVHGMDGVMRMYEHEGSRAAVTERAVGLVERALAGERWPARQRPADPPG